MYLDAGAVQRHGLNFDARNLPALQLGKDAVEYAKFTLLIRHELFMNPFVLSSSKPFNRPKVEGFLESVITHAGSIAAHARVNGVLGA